MADDPAPYELPDEAVAKAWRRLLHEYLVVEPLEPGFSRRFLERGTTHFAELGSSTGPISQLLAPQGVDCVAVDLNPPPGHVRPLVQSDLRHVGLRSHAFDGVSAVNCLYFLGDPVAGVREAARLLQPGGTFLASAPSRAHDPELAHVLDGWGEPSPFDAEDAAAVVGEVFADVEAVWWEAPAYYLPDRQAVVDYLVAFKQPDAEARAAEVPVPTDVTKSGCDVWAVAP